MEWCSMPRTVGEVMAIVAVNAEPQLESIPELGQRELGPLL